MKHVYLDNNATTPVRSEVREAVLPYLADAFANPSSLHTQGRIVRKAMETARGQIADALGADESEIVCNSSATEGNNTVLRGFVHPDGRNHIITTDVEHPCVRNTARELEKQGRIVTFLGVDKNGRIDPETLRQHITEKTGLVSVMTANNETGNIYPVKACADIAREHGALFHTDAVQAAGKIPLDVDAVGADFLTVSGHKFYGLKGSGALYIRRGRRVSPFITGGHQERGQRSGTENVPGIIAMGTALTLAQNELDDDRKRIGALRDRFESSVLELIPEVSVLGDPDNRLYNTSNLNISYIEGESMLLHLDHAGIAASTGSACSSGDLTASHVITAMHIDPEESHSSLRFSFGKHTTEEDVDYTLSVLRRVIPNLRAMSPLYTRDN